MNTDKLLDIAAVTFAVACIVVVLSTLVLCLPSGRWAVDANSAGEMYFQLIVVGLATPFTIWRLLRFMLRGQGLKP